MRVNKIAEAVIRRRLTSYLALAKGIGRGMQPMDALEPFAAHINQAVKLNVVKLRGFDDAENHYLVINDSGHRIARVDHYDGVLDVEVMPGLTEEAFNRLDTLFDDAIRYSILKITHDTLKAIADTN